MTFQKSIFLLIVLLSFQFGFGQDNKPAGTKLIDAFLSKQENHKAESALQHDIAQLKSEQLYEPLIDYVYYVGKISLESGNPAQATIAVTTFAKEIEKNISSVASLRQLCLELSSFYQLIGNPQKAYNCNLEALYYTTKLKDATGEDFGIIHSNLGVLAKESGDLALATQHHRKALHYLESYPGSSKERIYITYNSLGGQMWFASKIDSALYYYDMAEKTLLELEQTPINKYYRPAMLANNISAIYSSQGNPDKALRAMKKSIENIQAFLLTNARDVKKESAKSLYFSAVENYAGIFKDLGDYQKAKDLLTFSYEEKKKYYDADSPELFRSKILLGQIYLALKEYQLANEFLDAGIAHIEKIPGDFYFWNADAHYYKATIYEETGQNEEAASYYEEAQLLYEEALQGAYDEIYLEFIIRASYFYAKNSARSKALTMANEAYEYIIENQGKKTLFEFQQVLNLGEIHCIMGEYDLSFAKANESLDLLMDPLFRGNDFLDSIYISFQKPQALLLKSKSEYQLNKEKDTVFLKRALAEMQLAISILEQRKPFIGDDNNLSILIENNNSIFEFAKFLALELYAKTNSQQYLNIVFSLHESGLYNRIRSRLGTISSITYKNLPEEIVLREQTLKEELKHVLNDQHNIDLFFETNNKWINFLDSLKKNYPDYYKLRYASIAKSSDDLKNGCPENTTVVRYIFVRDSLYALILDKHSNRLFSLTPKNLITNITSLQSESLSFNEISELLYNLYQDLWKPFEKEISGEHIIIIPDRELFNLSFESLTPKKLNNINEFSDNSLLANYTIAYNYSLYLLQNGKNTFSFPENFIAFVPEFNDHMKKDYKISITDSMQLDKTYLTLLPQPFSLKLAKTSSRLFSGESFLNENSTKQIFKANAPEHKIIHIGTHAESNNLSPELSRIIFAKNVSGNNPEEDNSFYTYEIYDCNLSSNLTILTACETGKPTFQPGEGMISLAHAFNYAGSESILTSLWKIDEKSSVKIVELFYKHLAKGFSKDKALQQAKLEYLKSAEGRTLSPQYWAGLILIGDTSPILLTTSGSIYYWILGLIFISGFIFFLVRKKR